MRTIANILLVIATLALGARESAARSEGARMKPGEVGRWMKYTYEADIVTDLARDMDCNGKMDWWIHYRAGKTPIIERDTDGDGTPDLRTTVDEDPKRALRYTLEFLEGRYRIVPGEWHDLEWHGRKEKLVDGKWVRTFEFTGAFRSFGRSDLDLSSLPRKYRYVDGHLKESLLELSSWYEHFVADGPKSRHEEGPAKDNLRQVREITDARNSVTTVFDKGTPKDRYVTSDGRSRQEHWKDGKWELVKPAYPEQSGTLEDGTAAVWQEYDAFDKHWRVTTAKESQKRTYEIKVDGKWTKDFVFEYPRQKDTYKDGRIVRSEAKMPLYDWLGNTLIEYPTPETEELGDGKTVHVWRRYDSNGHRLVYEARDLDGDGKPDVIADISNMTVKQPDNPAPPWTPPPSTLPGGK